MWAVSDFTTSTCGAKVVPQTMASQEDRLQSLRSSVHSSASFHSHCLLPSGLYCTELLHQLPQLLLLTLISQVLPLELRHPRP